MDIHQLAKDHAGIAAQDGMETAELTLRGNHPELTDDEVYNVMCELVTWQDDNEDLISITIVPVEISVSLNLGQDGATQSMSIAHMAPMTIHDVPRDAWAGPVLEQMYFARYGDNHGGHYGAAILTAEGHSKLYSFDEIARWA